MKIALVVDNPYRDLPGMVLTGMALAQRGATVHLVPMNLVNKEVWALAPDYVLLNYLKKSNQTFVRHLLDAGVRVGVLDTEGGVLTSFEEYAVPMANDPGVRYGIDRFLTWGPKLAAHALQQGWYLPDQVRVTGHPRFNLHHPLWREAALRLSPYADAYPQPMVLINTNFSIRNPAFKTPGEELEVWVNTLGFDRQQVVDWQETQWQTLTGITTLTNHLAARYPDVTFVLRPHPFERIATYEALLDPRENIHIVREGTVEGWALRSSAVVQRNCSTAIDAMMAGKPALSPAWLPVALWHDAPEGVSITAEDEAAFEALLEQALDGSLAIPDEVQTYFDGVIADWFTRNDGMAHTRVVDAILESFAEGTPSVSLAMARLGAWGLLEGIGTDGDGWKDRMRVLGRLARWLPGAGLLFRQWMNRPARTDKWREGAKFYDTADVQRIVEALAPVVHDLEGEAWQPIRVEQTQARGDYHFGYTRGQAVTLSPQG